MSQKLTDKQEAFVEHYLANGFRATDAAKAAGYSAYSAKDRAAHLLQNPRIRAAIDVARAKTTEKIEVSKEQVIRELTRIAFSDIRKVARWEGQSVTLRSSDDLDDDTAASIQSINLKESSSDSGHNVNLTIKQHDKIKALELLGKYLALWQEQPQQTNTTINILNQFKGMTSKELIEIYENDKRKILGETDAKRDGTQTIDAVVQGRVDPKV